MVPRMLWIAGLAAALLGLADAADARPRRFLARQVEVTPVIVEEAPKEEALKQVTYPVAEFVVPISTLPDLNITPLPCRGTAQVHERPDAQMSLRGAPVASGQTLENDLMKDLMTKIAPTSWLGAGGRGTMQYYPLGMALVVRQTPAVHEEIKAALAALAKEQETEVTLEYRIIQVPNKAFEQARAVMKLAFKENERPKEKASAKWIVPARGHPATAFVTDEQVRRFLALTMNERSSKVMQAPSITIFPSQIATLQVTDFRFQVTGVEINLGDEGCDPLLTPKNEFTAYGLRVAMKPDVSRDRRFVRLNMNGYWSQPVGPVVVRPVQIPIRATLDENGKETGEPVIFQMFIGQAPFGQVRFNQQLNIPDGGTVLMDGGIVRREVEHTDWGSWLTSLVTGKDTSTWEDHHILLAVTARVVTEPAEQSVGVSPVPRCENPR